VESAAVPTPSSPATAAGNGVEDKDLMKNAVDFVSSVVIGEATLKGIILGSDTNKLSHLTDRPVLVVPAEER
jgi:hypothetical protein